MNSTPELKTRLYKSALPPTPVFVRARWLVVGPLLMLPVAVIVSHVVVMWLMFAALFIGMTGSVCIYVSRSPVWLNVLASVCLSVYFTFFGYLLIMLAAMGGG